MLGRGGEGNVKERLSSGRGDARQQWSDLGGAGNCNDGRDKIDLSRGSAGSDLGPAQPLSSHSLANLYDKIKALKGEFQSVEQRMRSAVEALPPEKRSKGEDCCLDGVSVRSSRGTDSDYGSEMNSRVSSPVHPFASPTPTPTPHVFSASCPPSRGVTNVQHQSLRPSCSPSSSISSFSYPHARSPSPSLSDYNSESTLRPSSPCSRGNSRLSHSETYVQIPVVVKGGCERIEVGGILIQSPCKCKSPPYSATRQPSLFKQCAAIDNLNSIFAPGWSTAFAQLGDFMGMGREGGKEAGDLGIFSYCLHLQGCLKWFFYRSRFQ